MFTTRAAPKIFVGDEDGAVGIAGVGEGMSFAFCGEPLDVVSKGVLANAVEGDALEKPRGDDAIGIDVVAAQRDAGAGDLADDFACLEFGYRVAGRSPSPRPSP